MLAVLVSAFATAPVVARRVNSSSCFYVLSILVGTSGVAGKGCMDLR